MSLRYSLQAVVRVVRRRVQQQVQQYTNGHAGRQADVAISHPAQHYHSIRPIGPNAVLRPNTQNLANRAAQVWRLTPSSWSRFTQANGSRTIPSSRPVLPLLLGFAGIGLVNQETSSPRGDEEAFAARSGMDLETAIQVVRSVFQDRGLKPDHLTKDSSTEFPVELAGYTFSKTILAKGTEGAVFAAKKQGIVPSSEGDEEFADPRNSGMPIQQQREGGQVVEQQKEELAVCDDEECNLAVKMMFNYNVGSAAADIMAEFEAERLPLVLAGGSFCQSSKYRSHPNIVVMHRAFVDDVRVPSLSSAVSLFDMALPARLNRMGAGADTTMYLVMKRYSTSLKDYLKMGCGLTDRTVMVIVAQLLEAVGYLGSQGVVHRDLKSNNILVDYEEGSGEAPHVVIADFGCSLSLRGKNLPDSVSIDDRNRQGNAALMAPEVKKAYHHNCLCYHDYLRADAWTVGAIMYEVCGQRNPFYDGVNSSGYEVGDLPQLQSEAVGLRLVSELLLQKDPGDRPLAQEAANILHLFLWQPSVSSFMRLSQGQSSVDSELTDWIFKISRMRLLLLDQAKMALPSTPDDPGIPRNFVERDLLETFMKRVNRDSLIDATQRLVTALQPLGSLAEFSGMSSLSVGMQQLMGRASNAVTLQA